jgi:hypothetical protein
MRFLRAIYILVLSPVLRRIPRHPVAPVEHDDHANEKSAMTKFERAWLMALHKRGFLRANERMPAEFPYDLVRDIAREMYDEATFDTAQIVADHYNGVPRELSKKIRELRKPT